MPLNHYVTLGRSGLRVSPFCLGTMTFGEDLGWGSSVEESQRILDRYIELGGNFIDTANFYTKSHSEKIIGDHVGRHPSRRERLVIATKFSGSLYVGDPNGGGSGRKSIIAACEHSLRRLQTDYIDLYWLHNWDIHTPMEETMAALEARMEDRRSQCDRPFSRLVGLHRPADRVFTAGAYGRAGTRSHGLGVWLGNYAVVTAQKRGAQRQVHPKERRSSEG
jgi:hypothetical protein